MADIFVSYSNKDLNVAHELAVELHANGYDVWWDYRLVGGANFRDAILNELTLARCVIVIWSVNSVSSEFVLDEADEARRANKLVSTCVADFQIDKLPLGFRNRHTIPLSDKGRLKVALDALGVLRSPDRVDSASITKGDLTTVDRATRPTQLPTGPVVLSAHSADKFGYIPYQSDVLGVLFEYPSKLLTLDTTRSPDGRFELMNDAGETEVWIFRDGTRNTRNVRVAQSMEAGELEKRGFRITYKAPQLENWDNWYVLAGLCSDKSWFYFRRWFTVGGLVSIEFRFQGARKHLYNEVIPDMTLKRFSFVSADNID